MRPAGSFCENEEEARIAQISNFTKTQHRRLAARLRQLDRGAAYAAAVVAEDGGLFQFQEAAAEWLRERFQPSRDTGSSRGYSFGERVQLPPSNDCTGAGATPPQRPQVAAQ